MILCDIGNTTYYFFYNNQELKFDVGKNPVLQNNDNVNASVIYYVSVNTRAEENLVSNNPCVDLSKYAKLQSKYDLEQLGADRVFLSLAVDDGVIVDVGSAITIDVVEDGVHQGGYIFPSISAYQKSYLSISPALDKQFNFGVSLDELPLNTADAMSASLIHPLVSLIKNISKDKKLFITGGDGKFLSRFFENALYDKHLIFRGMKKVIEDNNLIGEHKQ